MSWHLILHNQLYNSIITAHAILMSTPSSLVLWLVLKKPTEENSRVKRYQGGRAKLYGETPTPKLVLKGIIGTDIRVLRLISHLCSTTSRLTNLIRNILTNRNSAKWINRAEALYTLILSSVLKLFSNYNGIPRKEEKNYARDRVERTIPRNFGITYGNLYKAPKNQSNLVPRRGGDGVIVVGPVVKQLVRRVTVLNLHVRTLVLKAGSNVIRGSDTENTLGSNEVNIKAISNYKNLVSAYELIKSNPGNMTTGVSKETLDGISKAYIQRIQVVLKAGKFKFKPARRIKIPKPGKTEETRPLTIASPREKIVQKAVLLIMERLYENDFLPSSHGFRPKRGTHTAMKQLESNFQSVRYVIEADFAKAFDSIPHNILMNIIKERIKCEKTLKLIENALKAGFMEFGVLHDNLNCGTPQGSILSPLLCNIFLHKLDIYIEELKSMYEKGTRRRVSKEYMRLQNKVRLWRKKGYDKSNTQEFRALIKELIKVDSIQREETFVRIHYVRYADDFVVGIIGSHKLATEILSKLENFVNNYLKLAFNKDKTRIID